LKVPDVLMTGNHPQIARWREEQRQQRTQARRADLLQKEKTEPQRLDKRDGDGKDQS
jgi:tRNA (guanine-N1)-methyltransferase